MKGARKTTLTFGEEFAMVQVPVAVAPVASSKSDVKTELVAPSGKKTAKKTVDPETGEVLENGDIRRGVPVGDGYKIIEAEDWETITEETKPTEMEITEFVDPELPVVMDRLAAATDAHFVQAQEGAAGSLGVLVSAMEETGKVAIARWGSGARQRLGILRVRGDGALVIQTVPFAADIQEPDEDVLAASQAEISDKAAKLGKQLITKKAGKGKTLETAEDEAVVARKELVEKLLAGTKPKKSKKAKKEPSSDVEAALEAALA